MLRFSTALLLVFLSGLLNAQMPMETVSPDGQCRLSITLDTGGTLRYALRLGDLEVIRPSALGFRLSRPEVLLNRFRLVSTDTSTHDETWSPVWGEEARIRNHYRERSVLLQQRDGNLRLRIVFRLFSDGLAFRYAFPEQPDLYHFVVAEELTEFALTGDHKTFWIPGDYDTNEYPYRTTPLSGIHAWEGKNTPEIFSKSLFSDDAVQTPLMMKSAEGLYINIHEASLLNYSAMNLLLDRRSFTFRSALVPDALGQKAYLQTPAQTPWRTILVSRRAPDILQSRTILNLNEPSRIADPSWIKPGKFVGVWWEMHVGIGTWDLKGGQSGRTMNGRQVRHGANTENVKRYIDFAARYGIPQVLVEGWNVGWEDWFGQSKEDVFDFVTPYPDFDLQVLTAYAASKNVKLIMHHETSSSVTNYERQMDTAYRFMKRYGYDAVKTGYVGFIIPRGEHHDGQWMVRHYERVARKTAEYRICVDMHEPVRPTGLHRTYPNWLASEAARGNEFNAWSVGNPPEHETILPFTRLMGGPMDYTPGIFKIRMNQYDSSRREQVHTTLAKQLALYVTMYSPIQMAADLPENYEAKPDAFRFIQDVAVDWQRSLVLEAEPGDFILQARQAKSSANWFLGAITDEQPRALEASLAFLDPAITYAATLYRDADQADWKNNPEAYVIERFLVNHKTRLSLRLAPGGGAAASLIPATPEQIRSMKGYKKKK